MLSASTCLILGKLHQANQNEQPNNTMLLGQQKMPMFFHTFTGFCYDDISFAVLVCEE